MATVTSSTAGLEFSIDGGAFAAYPSGGYSSLSAGPHTIVARNATTLCASTATPFTIAGPLNCVPLQGCTLGYWKNHLDRWSCYSPSTLYGTIFGDGVAGSDVGASDGISAEMELLTLEQALNLGGGSVNNLARQSVAALLNACSNVSTVPTRDRVNYPLTEAQVITRVNAAFRTGGTAPGTEATYLDNLNNAGCPLGGTSATTANLTSGDGSAAASAMGIYPNPFSYQASVEFTLAKAERYNLQVLDMSGRVVSKVATGLAEAGTVYRFQIEGRDLAEGVYMVRLITDKSIQTQRLVLKK